MYRKSECFTQFLWLSKHVSHWWEELRSLEGQQLPTSTVHVLRGDLNSNHSIDHAHAFFCRQYGQTRPLSRLFASKCDLRPFYTLSDVVPFSFKNCTVALPMKIFCRSSFPIDMWCEHRRTPFALRKDSSNSNVCQYRRCKFGFDNR